MGNFTLDCSLVHVEFVSHTQMPYKVQCSLEINDCSVPVYSTHRPSPHKNNYPFPPLSLSLSLSSHSHSLMEFSGSSDQISASTTKRLNEITTKKAVHWKRSYQWLIAAWRTTTIIIIEWMKSENVTKEEEKRRHFDANNAMIAFDHCSDFDRFELATKWKISFWSGRDAVIERIALRLSLVAQTKIRILRRMESSICVMNKFDSISGSNPKFVAVSSSYESLEVSLAEKFLGDNF